MSGAVHVGAITLPKASAFTADQYLRVKLTAGVVAIAGAEDDYGTLETPALDGDTVVAVLPHGCGTVRKFIASAAIAKDAAVYAAAGGKVSSTLSGRLIGWARAAASGDGAEVEVIVARQGAAS